MSAAIKYIVAGISAYLAWLALPYILLALMAALCAVIGLAVGHLVSGYLPGNLPQIDVKAKFDALKARFMPAPKVA
jgi:hypothetical protein